MAEYKLIFFRDCPNYQAAVDLLNRVDLNFDEICQDELADSDSLKNYSSPTLLTNDQIIFGSKAIGGGCSMPLPEERELKIRLQK